MLMISVIDWSNVQEIIKKINIGLSEVSSHTVFKTGCVHVYAEWRLQQARVSTQNQTSCLPGLTHSCTVGMKAGNCICHTSFLKLSVTFQFLLQIRSTRKRFRMQKKKKSITGERQLWRGSPAVSNVEFVGLGSFMTITHCAATGGWDKP